MGFRLPTAWEYAEVVDYIYAGSDDVDEVGWYTDNSGLHMVRSKEILNVMNTVGSYRVRPLAPHIIAADSYCDDSVFVFSDLFPKI